MFIPGLEAFVFLEQHVTDRIQDSRVGLAGPIWRTGATLAALALGTAFQPKSLPADAGSGHSHSANADWHCSSSPTD